MFFINEWDKGKNIVSSKKNVFIFLGFKSLAKTF